ncbi:18417_t:CDS:10, partial [Acaulospora morrowiae]
AVLSGEYRKRIEDLNGNGLENRLQMTSFDFHTVCKNNCENVNLLRNEIEGKLESFAFFVIDVESNTPIFYQKGVFRTNCMDCLDRTNIVQTVISKASLEIYLGQIQPIDFPEVATLYSRHSYLWAENGDSLSKIYTGTGALKSEYTRSGKYTWAGVLNDATKTMNRFYINNFQDKSKQEVIDILLGKLLNSKAIEIHDPVNEMVRLDMQNRLKDFSEKSTINVFVGTYNLNGSLPSGESLVPWLFAFSDYAPRPHLFVIGFQEIVELMPQQIVSADPEKLRIWEREISRTLNQKLDQDFEYVIIRSGQLVGTALVIYARADIVSNIRNVEYIMKKTGLGGMAGNKGAVAIRLEYNDTSMCFVTAHFAAGHSNCEDRNRDYMTINEGLVFRNGRKLNHHNYVIWLGDFNYRISLDNDKVRRLVATDFTKLLSEEQLIRENTMGRVFTDYIEGPITFPPTYKYDSNSDEYDTSEKQRIPAWTDRILYCDNRGIRQIGYTRAEIRISDHRPVMALFDIEVIKYDEEEREKISRELYLEKLKAVSKYDDSTHNIKKGTDHENSNDSSKNWSKLAKNVKRVNDPVIIDRITEDINHKDLTGTNGKRSVAEKIDKNVGPAVGILIDLFDEDKGNKQTVLPQNTERARRLTNDLAPESSMVSDRDIKNRGLHSPSDKLKHKEKPPIPEKPSKLSQKKSPPSLPPRKPLVTPKSEKAVTLRRDNTSFDSNVPSQTAKPAIPKRYEKSNSIPRRNSFDDDWPSHYAKKVVSKHNSGLYDNPRKNMFVEDDDVFLARAPMFNKFSTNNGFPTEVKLIRKQDSKKPPPIKPKPKSIKNTSPQETEALNDSNTLIDVSSNDSPSNLRQTCK